MGEPYSVKSLIKAISDFDKLRFCSIHKIRDESFDNYIDSLFTMFQDFKIHSLISKDGKILFMIDDIHKVYYDEDAIDEGTISRFDSLGYKRYRGSWFIFKSDDKRS